MADVRFTPDQQKAIDTIDKSILVSAAAGSGKTAVLVERIINIIVQGKADVDRMLVVTFTNAAASEMRLKLIRAINKSKHARILILNAPPGSGDSSAGCTGRTFQPCTASAIASSRNSST